MLVGSDHLTDKSWKAANKVNGDLFMVAGATLYGFSECGFILSSEVRATDSGVTSKCCRGILRTPITAL
jgi:hypothetical protein